MLKLIIKDIDFNKTQILAILLAISVAAIFMMLRSPESMAFVVVLGPAVFFNQSVGRSCFMDDKYEAYKFLKSMPISKTTIVVSKYVAGLASLALTYSLLYIIGLALVLFNQPSPSLSIQTLLYTTSSLLCLFSVFLWLFFRKDFATAQHSAIFVIAIFTAIAKFHEYAKDTWFFKTLGIGGLDPAYLTLIAAATIFALLCRSSIKTFILRE